MADPKLDDVGSTSEKKDAPKKSSTESSDVGDAPTRSRLPEWMLSWLNDNLGWVKTNWTWSKIKPVIRCAVVGWLSAVLFIIPRVNAIFGQAGFLILIGAFLSPPSDPFLSVLEREILILLFVAIGWGWVSLGVFLASLTRKVTDPSATLIQVASGQYVEAAPTIIMAVFIFIGSAAFLFIKAHQGPGPYLFASVFGCICIDISLTTAVLYPYPFYKIGQAIFVPLAFHSALAILGSLLIFPATISALFTNRLTDVLAPLIKSLSLHERLFDTPTSSEEFHAVLCAMNAESKKSEAGLVPLAAAARLVKSDFIYARFAPLDFRPFQQLCRRLTGRADGLGVYFTLVDADRDRNHIIGTDVAEFDAKNAHDGAAGLGVDVVGTPVRPTERSRAHTPEPNSNPTAEAEQTKPPTTTTTTPNHIPPSPLSASISEQSGTLTPSGSHLPTTTKSHHHHFPSSLSHVFHPPSSSSSQPRHLHDILHSRRSSPAPSVRKAAAAARESTGTSARRREEEAVGVFESHRYLNLESTKLHDPDQERYTEESIALLRECCTPLLQASHLGLSTASNWLMNVRASRFSHVRDTFLIKVFLGSDFLGGRAKAREAKRKERYEDEMRELRKVRAEVEDALMKFREETRHTVLEPYRAAFEGPTTEEGSGDHEPQYNMPHADYVAAAASMAKIPPHRYLFKCYVYQYHLIQLTSIVIEMLEEILKLEEARPWPHCKLWTPVEHAFKWNRHLVPEDVESDGDEDPNIIQGLQHDQSLSNSSSQSDLTTSSSTYPYTSEPDHNHDLGMPRRRNPDILPPRNSVEWLSGLIYQFILSLGSGNVVFAVKAGLFTVILCLPNLIKSSAGFAYQNRFVWAIFMGQLTLARFRGDTAFGLTARIISTFAGGLTGLVMWYISCGSARGNSFGLAAVCAVCFPVFFFARLYWPIPPMTNIILFVTTALVLGFSYQDTLVAVALPASPGIGWSVAWKRFVLVTVGVTAAFLFSFLPPSTTIRRYQRDLLATTSCELGSIYCSILSFANTKHEPEIQEIIASLIAVRNKLNKSIALRANVGYEFSFRGQWPADRYKKIADQQMAISYSLSHLMSILEHLEPSWALAFLRRTRFMDPDFQGDILAVVSMITSSLRTGNPLPQITPCPLLDRFMLQYHGFNVIHKDAEEDYGLPRKLTIDTLKDEQYLMFCVGISTAFGVINQLDRLMIAVKQVVGEQYHIHGIGFHTSRLTPGTNVNALNSMGGNRPSGRSGVELGEISDSVHFRAPAGV